MDWIIAGTVSYGFILEIIGLFLVPATADEQMAVIVNNPIKLYIYTGSGIQIWTNVSGLFVVSSLS